MELDLKNLLDKLQGKLYEKTFDTNGEDAKQVRLNIQLKKILDAIETISDINGIDNEPIEVYYFKESDANTEEYSVTVYNDGTFKIVDAIDGSLWAEGEWSGAGVLGVRIAEPDNIMDFLFGMCREFLDNRIDIERKDN
jgi:hypothetical protein